MSKKALVISPIAPLMVTPKVDTERDDEVWYGMELEVLEELPCGFYKIRTPYRYESYIHGSHILFDDAEIARCEKAELKRVYQATADVMDTTTVKGVLIMTLVRGDVVEPVPETFETPEEAEKHKGWVKVRLIGGREGYIREKYIGVNHTEMDCTEDEFRKRVIETAMYYMGTQYRWGGKSPLGIDCSGLCGTAYLLNGVKIYRNAKIIEGFPVHEIPWDEKKPGDLIYFPGHVAMYLGNNKFLHSTSRYMLDGVCISSFDPADEDYHESLTNGEKKVGSIF